MPVARMQEAESRKKESKKERSGKSVRGKGRWVINIERGMERRQIEGKCE